MLGKIMSGKTSSNKLKNIDYKARLERKLYLARENPELVFDISDCALKNVPSGIYSLCKVFRKEALLMQCNKLTSLSGGGSLSDLSLISVLDLHGNDFMSLPPEIMYLKSLKEFYLQENKLKRLPDEITEMKNLSVLNVSKNQLKNLPENLGMLHNLTILDLSHNGYINILPKSLGYAQSLSQLNLNGLNLSYPEADILRAGPIVILAFLARECGVEYLPRDSNPKPHEEDHPVIKYSQDDSVQAALFRLEKMKKEKLDALIDVEKNIKQQQVQELELQNLLRQRKQKFMDELVNQQMQLEKEIEKVQHEKDLNRSRLLSYIYNAEREADKVINVFLKTSEEQRQIQAALIDREQKEIMQMLSISYFEQSAYRTKETLDAMEKLLEEELLKEKKLIEYTEFRNVNARSLLSLEIDKNDQLLGIMQDQDKSRRDLVEELRQDELLQKALVAALLERSDTRSWSIVQQVNLIQSQLAALTAIELERRKYQLDQQLNDIADKRVTLSAILVSLLDQQEERRRQLLDTLRQIEKHRDHLDPSKRDSLFWLLQYQSLVDSRPEGLLETLDSCLVRHVAISGALHCLPFLSTLPSIIHHLDDDQLISIGIRSDTDRQAIKMAVENYLAEKKLNSQEAYAPSKPSNVPSCSTTPIIERYQFIPSAPIECVVCMDSDCEVIFLPCGHFCCCGRCSELIPSECPMCRAQIEHKVRVQHDQ